MVNTARAYPNVCGIELPRVPFAWIGASIKFTGIHLYTRVERGTVRVKCLPQEYNMMTLSRAQIQTI